MIEVPKPKPPRRRPGRPSDSVFGVIGVVDRVGRSLAWSDGQWAGHPRLTAKAEQLVSDGAVLKVPGIVGRIIRADASNPVAAMAILAAVAGTATGSSGDVPVHAIAALVTQPQTVLDRQVA
jgi:hypothetical protein